MATPLSATDSDFLVSLQKHLSATTALAAALPRAQDVSFHRSVDAKVATRLDEASGRVWTVLQGLLGLVDGLKESESGGTKGKKRKRDEDGLVDDFARTIGDTVDTLLERAVSSSCDLR